MRLYQTVFLLGVTVLAAAFPSSHGQSGHLSRADNSSSEPYGIAKSPDDPARAHAIEVKRQNFLYGPSPVGQIPFFPAGLLGNATVQRDLAAITLEASAQATEVALDQAAVTTLVTEVC
jgi:hypothetical protein